MKEWIVKCGCAVILSLGLFSPARGANYCQHALLPIVSGAQWFYSGEWEDEEGGYGVSVRTVFTKDLVTNAILNLSLDVLGEAPLPVPLSCTEAEGIRLMELNSFSVPLPGGVVLKLQFHESSGVILPPMDQILSGTSWPFVLDFVGSLQTGQVNRFRMGLRLEVLSRFDGLTEVVVPAGSFQNVYRIKQDVDLYLSFGERISKPPKKFSTTRYWYLVENVGMVAADFGGVRTELIRYVVPSLNQ